MPQDAPPETATPTSEAQLAQVLADANRRGLKVVPLGGGTKADWGNVPERTDLVLSTLGLNRVLEHAAGDMTVTVEAGCTISSLQHAVAQRGQRLALDPLWPDRATVGGVLATNDSGALRAAYGSLRDLVLGVTVALPDGTLARSGGKVVKNVAGYDLPKLMVGAMGTLGVVTQATFRLHPLPRATRTWQFAAPTPANANRFVLAVHNSTLAVTGLQAVASHDPPCYVHLRIDGSPAGIESSAASVAKLAAACVLTPEHAADDAWTARNALFDNRSVVANVTSRITFLPSRFGDLCDAIAVTGEPWTLVAQGVGVGLLAMPADSDNLVELARRARALGGSLVVLRGPSELKRAVNVPEPGKTLPLMRAIKQQFDPSGTLNPGRLGGGL